MPFAFEPRHGGMLAMALAVAALGAFFPALLGLPLHTGTRLAFPLAGLAVALWALGDAAERRGWPWWTLGCLTLLGAAFVALGPLQDALRGPWATLRALQSAGWPLPRALWEALAEFNRSGFGQREQDAVALVVGGSALLGALGVALSPVRALGGHRGDRAARGGPWRAGWMPAQDVARLARNKTGLPLAKHRGRVLRYAPEAKRWRGGHHTVISGTRGGKGVAAVIPAILEHRGPVVCLDIKGENFAVTRCHRLSLGREVAVLNPFGVVEPPEAGFNPLDFVRPDHLTEDLELIADGLVRPEGGDGAHFAAMARELVAAALEVVVTQEEPPRRTLPVVADLLLAPDLDQTLEAWAQNPDAVGRRPAQTAATILRAGERERGAVQSTVAKAFAWMKGDAVRATLEGSTFDLDDLLEDRLDLFVVVPLTQVEGQAVFLRLLVNLVLGTAIRQAGRRRPKAPILLVLDEFVRLGRMERLLDVATVAAGVGVEALFVSQDLGQIEAVYGVPGAQTLLGACATKRVFNIGDVHTAQWAASHLGERTVLSEQRRIPAGPFAPPAERRRAQERSYSEQRQPLLTAPEILALPPDETLILLTGHPPLRAKLNRYHEGRTYRGRWDRNPLV